MKNGIYVIFAVFLLSAVVLGGCGTQSQERMDHAGMEETTDGGMQKWPQSIWWSIYRGIAVDNP